MEALSVDDIVLALRQALDDEERGLGGRGLQVGDAQLALVAQAADGDVRRGLTLLEIAAELVEDGAGEGAALEGNTITDATLAQVLAARTRPFATGGAQFYDPARQSTGEG